MAAREAFKLFRVRRDGSLGPLFINPRQRIPVGVPLQAEEHRTPGFAYRPGWHVTAKPEAPHLSPKGRQWFRVLIEEYEEHHRPAAQGGLWFTAKRMTVLGPLNA
jgi:hypothetical protein